MKNTGFKWQALGFGLLLLLVEGVLLAAATVGTVSPSSGVIQRYSDVSSSRPSSDAILAAMEQLTSPSEVSNYPRLRVILGTSNLQSQDPVASYLRELSNFSSNLQQITIGLQSAKASLATGNTQSATAYTNGLIVLRQKSATLLQQMGNQLTLIQIQHEATPTQIQNIRQRITELQRVYIEYSIAIDAVKSEITARTVLLTVAVSQATVFVDEPLQVQGQLQSRNGLVLAGRNVTIAWALNKTNVLTDRNGTFEAPIVFHPGYSSGITLVTAIFQPNGSDSSTFALTSAAAPVEVAYYPTRIAAAITPQTVLPLDQVTVTGNLTTMAGSPLENRTLQFQLDNTVLGNTTTETAGIFLFTFRTPASVPNGIHNLQVLFNPTEEVFAPTNAISTLSVQRDKIQIEARTSSSSVLSGVGLTVAGSVVFNSTGNGQDTLGGTATIALDGKPYVASTVGNDGKFSLSFNIPFDATFGGHSITIAYVPIDPRVDSSTITVQLYVYNSTVVAIIGATAVLAPSSLLLERRRRRLRLARQAVITPSEELLEETAPPFTPTDWDIGLKGVKTEASTSRKVIRCYRLARNLICSQLNYRSSPGETHWEFYQNVVKFKPQVGKVLERLTQLFELAEYSPFKMPVVDAREAERLLLKLQDAE